jgi:serine/threonine-protein kinase RsbT
MPEVRRVLINSDLDVVAARVEGRDLAREMGFGVIDQARIATAISELARNAAAYAHGGEIVLECIEPDASSEERTDTFSSTGIHGHVGLQILCIDQGPGIDNIEEILDRGKNSSEELGMGLSGTRRLMDEFEIDSESGGGTVVRACKWLR